MARPARKKPEKILDRPESPLAVISAVAQMALMVIGIIGVAVAIFGENGMLRSLASRLINFDFGAILVAVPLAVGAVLLLRYGYERMTAKKASTAAGTLAMYAMMALGAYYLLRYLLTGAFYG